LERGEGILAFPVALKTLLQSWVIRLLLVLPLLVVAMKLESGVGAGGLSGPSGRNSLGNLKIPTQREFFFLSCFSSDLTFPLYFEPKEL
jgi:hypothetical protein